MMTEYGERRREECILSGPKETPLSQMLVIIQKPLFLRNSLSWIPLYQKESFPLSLAEGTNCCLSCFLVYQSTWWLPGSLSITSSYYLFQHPCRHAGLLWSSPVFPYSKCPPVQNSLPSVIHTSYNLAVWAMLSLFVHELFGFISHSATQLSLSLCSPASHGQIQSAGHFSPLLSLSTLDVPDASGCSLSHMIYISNYSKKKDRKLKVKNKEPQNHTEDQGNVNIKTGIVEKHKNRQPMLGISLSLKKSKHVHCS